MEKDGSKMVVKDVYHVGLLCFEIASLIKPRNN